MIVRAKAAIAVAEVWLRAVFTMVRPVSSFVARTERPIPFGASR